MSSIAIAGIVFVCAFGGALVGMLLQSFLPETHLDKDSKEVIRMGTGLVASMAALVLGLLVAAATSAFNAQQDGFHEIASDIFLLDRQLAQFGPEAQPTRDELHQTVKLLIDHIWPPGGAATAGLASQDLTKAGGSLYTEIRNLPTTTDAQKSIQSQALQVGSDLAKARARLSQKSDSIPTPFLVVLGFWLLILFVSFGLFSPRNLTVYVMFIVSALSVAGAVFLIVDLDQPFGGLIQISSEPLRNVLLQIGR